MRLVVILKFALVLMFGAVVVHLSPDTALADKKPPRATENITKSNAKSKKQSPKANANTRSDTKAKPGAKAQTGAKTTSDAKTDTKADAKPKPPTTWSPEEIAAGRAVCKKILTNLDAVVLPETAFRKGGCGTPAPVRLIAVGSDPQVVLSPPAIMTCRLAGAIHSWATNDLQKLAKKHLNDRVIRIEVMSDYSCRNTYGRKNGKLSEHALANALDIRGFSTAGGKVVRLLSSWGPTARDIAAEKARAEKIRLAKLEAERLAKEQEKVRQDEQENHGSDTGRKKTAKQLVVKSSKDLLNVGNKLAKAAKTALAKGVGRQTPILPLSKRISQQGHFLRSAHKSACRIFGTTLGPEANEAHRNHFHVDMRPRKRSNYCE